VRIAFIDRKLNTTSGGGSNISLDETAEALAELGHDVRVITLSSAENSPPAAPSYQFVVDPAPDSNYANVRRLAIARVLMRHQADVDVYCIEAPSLILGGALYRLLGGSVPVVAHFMDFQFFCTDPARMDGRCHLTCSVLDRIRHRPEPTMRKLLLAPLHVGDDAVRRMLANRVDRFIAISPAVGDIYALQGIDARKIVSLPLAGDYQALAGPRTTDAATREAGVPFSILYVGRLVKQKGVALLIRAVAQLDFPFTLNVVGDGPERAELERLARDLGVQEAVRFHGWLAREKIASQYLATHLFVHPGIWPEPFGLTIVEALAAGAPTIVSDIGGPPDTVGDAGLSFPPGDVSGLAERIRQVYSDPDLAARLSAQARERAKQFATPGIVPQLEAMFRHVIQQEASRGANGTPASA
jgi:glycosyltransferase involved in cell wall biosynthesis